MKKIVFTLLVVAGLTAKADIGGVTITPQDPCIAGQGCPAYTTAILVGQTPDNFEMVLNGSKINLSMNLMIFVQTKTAQGTETSELQEKLGLRISKKKPAFLIDDLSYGLFEKSEPLHQSVQSNLELTSVFTADELNQLKQGSTLAKSLYLIPQPDAIEGCWQNKYTNCKFEMHPSLRFYYQVNYTINLAKGITLMSIH